jgi:uncharacterized protein YceH (UPF0502 family)
MNQSETSGGPGPAWVPLTPRERRVVGVLAEKSRMTPEYYPLSVAAIVAGCNQKSNRDPITSYDQDDVEETLQSLRKKGAAILVEGVSSRVPRWRHTLYDWLKATKSEMAVIIELLLRGPQTEGELRARASRMEPLPDLAALQALLDALAARGLVVYLSPPGQKRGVMITHGLYPADELEKVREAFAAGSAGGDEESPARVFAARAEHSAGAISPAWAPEIASVRAELDELRNRLDALVAEIRELKSALGA